MICSTLRGSDAAAAVGTGSGGMVPIIRRGSDRNCRGGTPVARSRPAGTMVPSAAAGEMLDKGLIGFDVGTGSDIVRPELLRLVKRGNNTTANSNGNAYTLAA
jgi:hypothetical protein